MLLDLELYFPSELSVGVKKIDTERLVWAAMNVRGCSFLSGGVQTGRTIASWGIVGALVSLQEYTVFLQRCKGLLKVTLNSENSTNHVVSTNSLMRLQPVLPHPYFNFNGLNMLSEAKHLFLAERDSSLRSELRFNGLNMLSEAKHLSNAFNEILHSALLRSELRVNAPPTNSFPFQPRPQSAR